jgi:hypothetical protein
MSSSAPSASSSERKDGSSEGKTDGGIKGSGKSGGGEPPVISGPKFRQIEKVPKSKPYMDGLEESFVKKLLDRRDDLTPLGVMMEEEVMSVTDLMKRMREDKEKGIKFSWDPGQRLQRLRLIMEKKPVGDDMRPPHEVSGDRPGTFAQRLKRVAPRPRGPEVCTWSGYDQMENIYMCNNDCVHISSSTGAAAAATPSAATDPRDLHLLCPWHIKFCCGEHGPDLVHIVTPNNLGLCFPCYAKKSKGKAPSLLENELLVPGIHFSQPANRRNPLAPPSYRRITRKDHRRAESNAKLERTRAKEKTLTLAESSKGQPKGFQKSKYRTLVGHEAQQELAAYAARVQARVELEQHVLGGAEAVRAAPSRHELFVQMMDERDLGWERPHETTAHKVRRVLMGRPPAMVQRNKESVTRERLFAARIIFSFLRSWHQTYNSILAVEYVRAERAHAIRSTAASLCQRTYRRILQQRKFKIWQAENEHAAERIQRLFRRFAWRTKLARDQSFRVSATRIQRWFRTHRVLQRLRIVHERAEAHRRARDKPQPTDTIYRVARLAQFRAMVRDVKRRKKVVKRAAIIIQRAWLWFVKRPSTSKSALARAKALLMLRGFFKMSKWMKNYFRRREARAIRREMYTAIALISRVGKGFLARLKVRARRARVEAVWRWVAPTIPREMVAQYLGFPEYGLMFDLNRFKRPTGFLDSNSTELSVSQSLVSSIFNSLVDAPKVLTAEELVVAREAELFQESHECGEWMDRMSAAQLEELRMRDGPDAVTKVINERREQRAQFERVRVLGGDKKVERLDKIREELDVTYGLTMTSEDELLFEGAMRRV